MTAAAIKVLLCEDDSFQRTVVRDMCVSCGYEVSTVESGEQCITLVEASHAENSKVPPWDMVLCDVHLGAGPNGVDVLLCLRRLYGTSTSVVMISSNDHTDIVERCILEGADSFMLKPLSKQEIIAAKSFVLRRRRLAAAAVAGERSLGIASVERAVERAIERGSSRASSHHASVDQIWPGLMASLREAPPPQPPPASQLHDRSSRSQSTINDAICTSVTRLLEALSSPNLSNTQTPTSTGRSPHSFVSSHSPGRASQKSGSPHSRSNSFSSRSSHVHSHVHWGARAVPPPHASPCGASPRPSGRSSPSALHAVQATTAAVLSRVAERNASGAKSNMSSAESNASGTESGGGGGGCGSEHGHGGDSGGSGGSNSCGCHNGGSDRVVSFSSEGPIPLQPTPNHSTNYTASKFTPRGGAGALETLQRLADRPAGTSASAIASAGAAVATGPGSRIGHAARQPGYAATAGRSVLAAAGCLTPSASDTRASSAADAASAASATSAARHPRADALDGTSPHASLPPARVDLEAAWPENVSTLNANLEEGDEGEDEASTGSREELESSWPLCRLCEHRVARADLLAHAERCAARHKDLLESGAAISELHDVQRRLRRSRRQTLESLIQIAVQWHRAACTPLEALHTLAQEVVVVEAEALAPLTRLSRLTKLMLDLVHLQRVQRPEQDTHKLDLGSNGDSTFHANATQLQGIVAGRIQQVQERAEELESPMTFLDLL